jgi:hypothetical protein
VGDVPAQFAGRILEIGLFGPGNVVDCWHQGSAWLSVIRPDGVAAPFTWYAKADPGTNRTGDPDLNPSSPMLLSGDHLPTDMGLMSIANAASRPHLLQPLFSGASPPNASTAMGQSYPIGFEENPTPPGGNIQGVMVADDGSYFFDGSWLYIDVQVPVTITDPSTGLAVPYPGGYWKLQYVPVPRPVPGGGILAADRLTMTLKVKGAPAYLVE